MKKLWLLAAPVLLLAACGKPAGGVRYVGMTPLRPQDPDGRGAVAFCTKCGKKVDLGAVKCGDAKCGAQFVWPDKYKCGFCGGAGECRACVNLGQKDQVCYNCKGEGFITFEGKTPPCSHCAGTKKCQICKDSPGKCDQCKGQGTLTKDQVSGLIKKAETKKAE